MKRSIFSKLKKALVVMIIFITIVIAMPKKSCALDAGGILSDFVNLVLHIPDGAMGIVDDYFGDTRSQNKFTWEPVNLKGVSGGGYIYNFILSPYEILSSGSYDVDSSGNYHTQIGWFDINFFSDKKITSETEVSSAILAPVIGNIYRIIRNSCMVLMLLVILYIGIKIVISSIAEQQAKYKRFLVDWLVGFALLFMMHYIMSGIVNLNTFIVGLLSNEEGDAYYIGFPELADNGSGGDSTWNDVVTGNTTFVFNGEKYTVFKETRLCVEGTANDGVNYTDKIDKQNGYINLNGLNNKRYKDQAVDLSTWGKNGEIYLSASIYNSTNDNEKYGNKVILKLNMISYVRTISNWGSSIHEEDVQFYNKGGMTTSSPSTGMGYSMLYLGLCIETVMFVFIYMGRVLKMSFLTMIAPIVATMYPVDKLGDGKAQSFNTWFKDYLFNVLTQPMHLFLYTVFIVAAGELLTKNILYAVAIYGFMIPAEKYIKKVLGFEKASNGAGGPLGGAIGHGIAMDGLGKLAGIGPFGGKSGSGGSGDSKHRKPKLTKNKVGTIPLPGSSGGDDPSSSGGSPNSSGSGGSGRGAGRGQNSGNRNPNASGGNNPNAGGGSDPNAGGGNNPNAGGGNGPGAFRRAVGKRIARAATGGNYSSFRTKGAVGSAIGHAALGAGKFVGKNASRLAGAALLGGVGLTAGVATAMATGDINSVWKGATVGIGAGNKMGTNLWSKTEGFIGDFHEELEAERAKLDPEKNAKLRREQAYKNLDEELADMSDDDRKKYSEVIEKMAPYVNFSSMDDVKSMEAAMKGKDLNSEENVKDVIATYDDAHQYQIVGHEESYLADKAVEIDNSINIADAKALAKAYNETGATPSGTTPAELAFMRALDRMNRAKEAQKPLKK